MDFKTAQMIWEHPWNDELILNHAAYHLQQTVEKVLKGALECAGVTVPNIHKITKLVAMISNHGANLVITEWLDDHSEMLSEWEAETRYNMDFLVEAGSLNGRCRRFGNFSVKMGYRRNCVWSLGINPEGRNCLCVCPGSSREAVVILS